MIARELLHMLHAQPERVQVMLLMTDLTIRPLVALEMRWLHYAGDSPDTTGLLVLVPSLDAVKQ